MFYILLIIALLINFNNTIDETDKSLLKIHRKKSFAAAVFTTNHQSNASCEWLNRLKFQNKLCYKRRGLPETIHQAQYLAVKYCEEKFKYDQWNCSRPSRFFKKIYRETALMYSITSSALMYAIARACSDGTLAGCKCGDYDKKENASDWQWGGCADNTKFARKFTRKFLQLRKKGDHFSTILKHNAEVGIKVVLENETIFCRCHGVSGSCTVKICWKRIRPFDEITEKLKKLYHGAIQIHSNHLSNLQTGKQKRKLLYLEDSPNFCLSTAQRQCKNTENCATLCCGRGFYPRTIHVVEQCNCSWRDRNSYLVQCEECARNGTILICK